MRGIILNVLCVALVGLAGGCTFDSTKPTTRPSLAEQAAKDPFFTPDSEKPNISGGGFNNFDKDAFQKDWNNVWNP